MNFNYTLYLKSGYFKVLFIVIQHVLLESRKYLLVYITNTFMTLMQILLVVYLLDYYKQLRISLNAVPDL